MRDSKRNDQAERLARRLHEGQFDKAGIPYAGHLERVVARLLERWPDASDAEIEAAWLHDALEDTDATAQSLLEAGVSPETVRIVEMLTRPDGVDYFVWINTLAASGHTGALRVKLADNADNSDPSRVAALGDGGEKVRTRYAPAKVILEAALKSLERR